MSMGFRKKTKEKKVSGTHLSSLATRKLPHVNDVINIVSSPKPFVNGL